MAHPTSAIGNATWLPKLVRQLRGRRTQAQFGEDVGVPKNTVWRWEAGYSQPTPKHAQALSELADQEGFFADWPLAGSVEILGDLEGASKEIARLLKKSLERTSRELNSRGGTAS